MSLGPRHLSGLPGTPHPPWHGGLRCLLGIYKGIPITYQFVICSRFFFLLVLTSRLQQSIPAGRLPQTCLLVVVFF